MEEELELSHDYLHKLQSSMVCECGSNRSFTEWNNWRFSNPNHKILLYNEIFDSLDFSNANLKDANLSESCLRDAKLYKVNLNSADLSHTDLNGSKLEDIDLCNATLNNSKLRGITLCNANLAKVDLRLSSLIMAQIRNVDLTGAKIYGWNITDVKFSNIKCDYVYIDEAGKDRLPKDRDFEPGEFEALYKQLPSFEHIFEHGMNYVDIPIMSLVAQKIKEQHPQFDIKIESINNKFKPSIKFTVAKTDFIKQAQQQVEEKYKTEIQNLLNDNNKLKIEINYSEKIRGELLDRLNNSEKNDILMNQILSEVKKLNIKVASKEELENEVHKIIQIVPSFMGVKFNVTELWKLYKHNKAMNKEANDTLEELKYEVK